MSKKSQGVTRREFLLETALASGALALTGLAPTTSLAAQAEAKLGAQFIGKLEGPEILRDVAKFPKQFAEAPMLAALVTSGKLPSVDKRLPAEPCVTKPLKEVGKYSAGPWRGGFTGPGDGENGNRLSAVDKFIFWDYTGTKIGPSLCKAWKVSEDGKVIGLTLRKQNQKSTTITLGAGDTVRCTYTNTKRASLTIVKRVVNDNGGAAAVGDKQVVNGIFAHDRGFRDQEHVASGVGDDPDRGVRARAGGGRDRGGLYRYLDGPGRGIHHRADLRHATG